MRATKKGFSLFELLISLTFSTLMISMVCAFGIHVFRSVRAQGKSVERLLECACALDSLEKDVVQAVQEGYLLTRAEKTACIFRLAAKDIGWIVKNNRLMRYEGRFNESTNTWSGVSSSRLVSYAQINFAYDYKNGRCIGIHSVFSTDTSYLERYSAL